MATSASLLAALAGVPSASRHLQGSFGPATLRLAGARAVLELDDGGAPPLRLTWTDGPDHTVGAQIAALLRTQGTAVFERLDLLRIASRRKITDPPPAPGTSDAPRSVQTTTVDDGIRIEIASHPATRNVVLSAVQAHDLADLLEAWAALPA
ncbi:MULTISPECIES: hypothetical protein [unclassified Frankia]|uniref:hypothetical protein n=1 Tax=unclassified Frankia TaxID=2632575 RepID=UPI002AD4C17C|nr:MULTISPECIES: hypothetical protein [unclassified Frankia]